MGLDFIGNPYEQDEIGDSEFEGNGEDDWITLPNDMVILDGRDQIENIVNPTFDWAESSDEDGWADEVDDEDDVDYDPEEDYNPDDENYEFESELEDVATNFFFNDTDFDDDDDDEYDYVTLPLNPPTTNVGSPETVKTSPEEMNTTNPDNADAD